MRKYHKFRTMLEKTGLKSVKELNAQGHTLKELYKASIVHAIKLGTKPFFANKLLSGEYEWFTNGKPTFRLDNSVIDDFSHLDLNIPKSFILDMSETFIIQLPIDNKLNAIWQNQDKEITTLQVTINSKDGNFEVLVCLQFAPSNYHLSQYIKSIESDFTIEDSLRRNLSQDFQSNSVHAFVDHEIIEKAIRIIFSTILFKINAHILPCSADLLDIYDKNLKKRGKRAKRAIKGMGIINNNNSALELFSEYVRTISINGNYRTTLKYQHIRKTHWAWRWCGKGPNKIKCRVKVKQAIVRKDLPKKPIEE